jgi:hypothetical protein
MGRVGEIAALVHTEPKEVRCESLAFRLLLHRPHQSRMGPAGAIASSGQTRRTSTQRQPTGDSQRSVLGAAQWLPLAIASAHLGSLVYGVRLLPRLAPPGGLGAYPYSLAQPTATAQRTRADAQCRYHRQPVGQN